MAYVNKSYILVEPAWMAKTETTVKDANAQPAVPEVTTGPSSILIDVPNGKGKVHATTSLLLNVDGPDSDSSHPPSIKLVTDNGDVELDAGHSIKLQSVGTIGLIAEPTGSIESDHTWDKDTTQMDKGWTKLPKYMLTVGDLAAAIFALYLDKERPFAKMSKPGASGWWVQVEADRAKWWVDIIKVISSMGRWAQDAASTTGSPVKDTASSGSIDIFALSSVSVSGAEQASMYGTLSASVNSILSASMLGVTAGIRGLMWASVWGMDTSIKGIKKISVKSEKGVVSVRAKQKAEITSETDVVLVTGKKKVQINSTSAGANVHGATSAYIGAGEATGGFGALSTPSQGVYGFVTNPKAAFPTAYGDFDVANAGSLTLYKRGAKLAIGTTAIKVTKAGVNIESQGPIKLTVGGTSGGITVNAGTLELG